MEGKRQMWRLCLEMRLPGIVASEHVSVIQESHPTAAEHETLSGGRAGA